MSSAVSHTIDDYESLLVALQNVLGVVVPDAQRSCLVERVEPLLTDYQLDSLATLASQLQQQQADDIRASVLQAISKRHSDWAFSSSVLHILKKYVFAQLPQNARIWVVGSGQGQLAYSVAMEIVEYESNNNVAKEFSILATDNVPGDIKLAEQAVYSASQLSELSELYKRRYTTVDTASGGCKIKDKIRQMLHFTQCDLTQDFQSIEAVDLIICPEILMYYSNGVKAGILQQFSALLKSGRILLVGGSQAVTTFSDGFERVEHPSGIFYRQKI